MGAEPWNFTSSDALAILHITLQQLNTLISTQVANNPDYQHAMYAGRLRKNSYGTGGALISEGTASC